MQSSAVLTGFKDTNPYYFTVDVETTMKSDTSFSATPFDPKNRMLSFGFDELGTHLPPYIKPSIVELQLTTSYQDNESVESMIGNLNAIGKYRPIALIGHNIKFDLHYLMLNGLDLSNVKLAYDTQYMYYLLTGEKSPSLNEVADYYKLPRKEETLSTYIEKGIPIEDIPVDEMQKYLERDVLLTGEVFLKLLDDLCKQNNKLTLTHINARLNMGLQAMEMNGLFIDKAKLFRAFTECDEKVIHHEAGLNDLADNIYPDGAKPPRLHTTKTLNQILRGQPFKVKEKIEVGKFKNGNTKYKTVEKQQFLDQPIVSDNYWTKKERKAENPSLGLPMGEQQLSILAENAHELSADQRQYLTHVVDYRKSSKLKDAFLKPLGDYLKETESLTINPIYNCTTTSTGRLSSTNPNAQNQPPEVDALFTVPQATDSAFTVRASADFKQLEIWAAAVLSGDEQLIEDIKTGTDIPDTIARQANLSNYKEHSVRRRCKVILYGTIYGGYPAGLSKQTGWDKTIITEIQDVFFARYRGLRKYYDEYIKKVNNSPPVRTSKHNGGAIVSLPSITGRSYMYSQYPQWNGKLGFNTAQLYNYRIQGFATGDVVPLYIACFMDVQPDFCFLERTVHDQLGTRWNLDRADYAQEDTETIRQAIEETYETALKLTQTTLETWLPRLPKLPLKLDMTFY